MRSHLLVELTLVAFMGCDFYRYDDGTCVQASISYSGSRSGLLYFKAGSERGTLLGMNRYENLDAVLRGEAKLELCTMQSLSTEEKGTAVAWLDEGGGSDQCLDAGPKLSACTPPPGAPSGAVEFILPARTRLVPVQIELRDP